MTNQQTQNPNNQSIDYKSLIPRMLNALIKRIEGGDDTKAKLDYLAKLDDETKKSLANLTDSQIESCAECDYLASSFPSMRGLQTLTGNIAVWSPSKGGKRAEQITATMTHNESSIIPTVFNAPTPTQKAKKSKEPKGDEKT